MANYLVAGVGGTGKSSIYQELVVRGYRAIDSDESTYAHWVERATGKSFSSRPNKGEGWADRYDWLWRPEIMNQQLQSKDSADLFVCGVSNNLADFYPLFEQVFLLTAPPAIIVERLKQRTTNSFGKNPTDIEQTLDWQKRFDKELAEQGAIVIDATLPIQDVTSKILSHVAA